MLDNAWKRGHDLMRLLVILPDFVRCIGNGEAEGRSNNPHDATSQGIYLSLVRIDRDYTNTIIMMASDLNNCQSTWRDDACAGPGGGGVVRACQACQIKNKATE